MVEQDPLPIPLLITEQQLHENYLIEVFTGKSIDYILNNYTLPELMRVNAYLDWIKFM